MKKTLAIIAALTLSTSVLAQTTEANTPILPSVKQSQKWKTENYGSVSLTGCEVEFRNVNINIQSIFAAKWDTHQKTVKFIYGEYQETINLNQKFKEFKEEYSQRRNLCSFAPQI